MKKTLWTGRILSALPALFLLSSGINLMFIQTPDVRASFARFGYQEGIIPVIGMIETVCALIYMIPKTSVLGAILLTAYLGGAVATHVRVSEPLWIIPVVLGIVLWAGLLLRDDRLRALVPLRRQA